MVIGWVEHLGKALCRPSIDSSKYRLVNMNTGDLAYFTVDSLAAFWPGMQVLAGDVENAIKLHMLCSSYITTSSPQTNP